METRDELWSAPAEFDGKTGVAPHETMEEEGVEVDGEVWSNLGEELQENVLARLPLLKLFQVPILSKGWRLTILTPRFREEVTGVSARWSYYCPLHLSRKGLVGYDADSQRWQKLFTLSYLPYVPQGQDVVRLCSSAGSLICFARRNKTSEREMFRLKQRYSQMPPNLPPDFRRRLRQFCMANSVEDELSQEAVDIYAYIDAMLSGPHNLGVGAFDMYVTNVVTRRWIALPCRPNMLRPHIVQLVPLGTRAYKVILITLLQQRILESTEGPLCVQVYDSTTGSWTRKLFSVAISSLEMNVLQASRFVYLEGVFYIIVQGLYDTRLGYQIMAFNVEQDCWIRIPRPRAFTTHDFLICELVVCGADVMLVTVRNDLRERLSNSDPPLAAGGHTGKERLLVYRLDSDSMTFLEVSRGPRAEVLKGVSNLDLVTGAGDCIYFGLRAEPGNPIVVFNVRRKQWSSLSPAYNAPGFSDYLHNFRWTKFPFQPGLNPFLELV